MIDRAAIRYGALATRKAPVRDVPPRPHHSIPDRTARALHVVVPLGGYTALAVALFHSTWQRPFYRAIGDGGDTLQNVWWLAWTAHAVTHGSNPLFTNYMVYPEGANLLWNTSYPLIGTLLAPVTIALGPVFAFNVMMTLAIGLSAWTAFLLFRRLSSSDLGAALGGLIYGFSPFMVAQSLGHPQVTLAFIPPLILIVLHELVVASRRPVPLGIAIGLLAAMQLLIGEEILAMTGVGVVLLLVIAASMHPDLAREKAIHVGKGVLTAACVCAALVAAPLAFQFFGPQRVSHLVHGTNLYISDALSFFLPTAIQQLAPAGAINLTQRFKGNLSEWDSYLGLPLIVLMLFISVRYWRHSYIRAATLGAIVVCIWSMGVGLHFFGQGTRIPVVVLGLLFVPLWRSVPVPALLAATFLGWLAMWQLPVLNNILSVRLMVLAYLLIGAVVAMFVAVVQVQSKGLRSVAMLALVLAVLPLVPTFRFPSTSVKVPIFFTTRDVSALPDGSVALVLPIATSGQQAPLLWQAASGMRFRQTGGYAFTPGPAGRRKVDPPKTATADMVSLAAAGQDPLADTRRRTAVMNELDALQVRTVILGPMDGQDYVRQTLVRLLGREPEFVGGVWIWRNVELNRSNGSLSQLGAADRQSRVAWI
jgi:flagellar biosynthesis protein FliQ